MKVSIFASSVRTHLWKQLLDSLKGTSVSVEIVFAGNAVIENPPDDVEGVVFKYIETKNIKPAQCYEIAARKCTGEVLVWAADDCEFPDDVIGKAYRFYKEHCSHKDIVCIRSRENYGSWQECDGTKHFFDNHNHDAPKMAPLAMVSREYYHELGGADRRYICGQWENDIVMRLYNDGGKLHMFEEAYIELDHINKHGILRGVDLKRSFAMGFASDRKILEGAWHNTSGNLVKIDGKFVRFDSGFEPYVEEDIRTKTQSFNLANLFSD